MVHHFHQQSKRSEYLQAIVRIRWMGILSSSMCFRHLQGKEGQMAIEPVPTELWVTAAANLFLRLHLNGLVPAMMRIICEILWTLLFGVVEGMWWLCCFSAAESFGTHVLSTKTSSSSKVMPTWSRAWWGGGNLRSKITLWLSLERAR